MIIERIDLQTEKVKIRSDLYDAKARTCRSFVCQDPQNGRNAMSAKSMLRETYPDRMPLRLESPPEFPLAPQCALLDPTIYFTQELHRQGVFLRILCRLQFLSGAGAKCETRGDGFTERLDSGDDEPFCHILGSVFG